MKIVVKREKNHLKLQQNVWVRSKYYIRKNDTISKRKFYNNRIMASSTSLVKSLPFHGSIVGSNPAEVTNNADIV